MRSKLILIVFSVLVYWILMYYVPYGRYVILPIHLFVTFLHEFGHSMAAILTGGNVHEVFIQTNGAGYAVTAGGSQAVILMGGYLGSALWGNLLLYIGLCKPKSSLFTLYVVIFILLFTAFVWYSSALTSFILVTFSVLAFWMGRKSKRNVATLLMVLGATSIVYIMMDYKTGPSSDLAKFAELFPILPKGAWALVWLGVVIWMTWVTLKKAVKRSIG